MPEKGTLGVLGVWRQHRMMHVILHWQSIHGMQ